MIDGGSAGWLTVAQLLAPRLEGSRSKMTLVTLTVLVIALFIAVLAIYLFVIGMVLNRTAGNLGDCVQSMRTIIGQANAIGPGVKRINKAGTGLVEALPLLVDGAEQVAAKSAPAATPPAPVMATSGDPIMSTRQDPVTSSMDSPRPGVGYMDE
jgi:hypothetical protein